MMYRSHLLHFWYSISFLFLRTYSLLFVHPILQWIIMCCHTLLNCCAIMLYYVHARLSGKLSCTFVNATPVTTPLTLVIVLWMSALSLQSLVFRSDCRLYRATSTMFLTSNQVVIALYYKLSIPTINPE